MNSAFPDDPQLNFFKDFTDDVEDMRAAYDALDERTTREIENLVCRHSNT